MSFELHDHTADVAVAGTGTTLGAAYAAVADGLAAAMCEDIPNSGTQYNINVIAEGREALLFDYLDELIYRRDTELILPVANSAEVTVTTEWELSGSFRGVPLADVIAREVKAVTYSDMCVKQTNDLWKAYVVFDV
jgi:SHS2 domain-containing protein